VTTKDADREFYLQQALEAFESGTFDAYEYTQRVQAIDRATSEAEMAKALGRRTPPTPAASTRPALDPVDLARMISQAAPARRGRQSNRYTMLVMVVVIFVVLLVMGVWLTARVHSNSNPSGAAVRPAEAGVYASAVLPPSPLSPRR